MATPLTTTFTDLLGPTLQSKEGSTSTDKALAGLDAVLIYFSAHWCPPCRGFTPKLAQAYDNYKKAGKKLEIVFVSSDKSQEAFDEYFADMPWLALPFSERDAKAKLSKKYKVNGIPSLVVLDGASGEIITKDGRSAVGEDPNGDHFPWKPSTLWEALGEEVLNGEGDTVDIKELRGPGKVLGLYFSAHWCPPCRQFTPKLVECYTACKAAGKEFEVIFLSSDRSPDDFQSYFASMPWLAIPQGDKRKESLSKLFEVEGIPSFVVIDAETGDVINANARGAVMADPEGAAFPWMPPAVGDLSSPDGINETASLCAMLEGCDEATQATALAVLTPIAEKAKAAGDELLFFSAKSSDGAVPQVRKLASLATEPPAQPQLVLLDIPDDGGYYVAEPAALTAESVAAFLDAYKAKTLERKQLS